MKTIKDNRYNNLLRLLEEAGSMVRLEERTGVTANYLRQIKNKNVIQNGKPKGIGDKIAAKLEDGMNKPRGWLDLDHSGEKQIAQEDVNEDIVIDVLNVSASAGFGKSHDLVEIVTQMHYVPDEFYALFRNMNPESIRIINLSGDSMQPTFESGDMLFVDISVNSFTGDGVYVFTYKGHLYVKRLQNIGDKLLVISDNEVYKKWSSTEENQEYLFIHARVKVHQSQKLNFLA